MQFRLIGCKITKNFKNLKIFGQLFLKFAHVRKLLYLCTMKQIEYTLPVRWLRGNISGRQQLTYNDAHAYDANIGDVVAAEGYQPRFIAKVRHAAFADRKTFFQVRTRSTVNMTAGMKRNLALMGGSGALYASLISDKTTLIYNACVNACPRGITLRAFIVPILRQGLAAKQALINVADGVGIVNPWVSTDDPNVPVTSAILDKFASELS